MNFYRLFDVVEIFLQKPDRTVALTRPQSQLLGYPSYYVIKVFHYPEPPNEIIIHKAISSVFPQALQVYDDWMDSGYYFFCMEYCSNGDLHKELVARNGEIYSFDFILYRCLELANIVQTMHGYGYVHRDIKPLNIYITANYEFKLADFGEAKYVDDINGFQTITGTPYYMSPEIRARHFQKLDLDSNPFRDDIWALARTFIEISLAKLCPEIASMNTSKIQEYIYTKFCQLSYPMQFYNLIISMMSQNTNDFIQAQQVYDELLWMYTTWYAEAQENASITDNDTEYTERLTENLSEKNPSEIDLQVRLQTTEEEEKKRPEIHNQITVKPIEAYREENINKSMPVRNHFSIYTHPAYQTVNHNQPSADNCKICISALTDDSIVFSCGHSFHKSCTTSFYEEILSANKKPESLQCFTCKAFIKPDLLAGLTFNNEKANSNFQLLIYSITRAECPRCQAPSDEFMLSRHQPKNKKCKGCKAKFCSFCCALGGHRFSCDLFKSRKIGN